MEINADILATAAGALSAFIAGGGLSFVFWKGKATQAAKNLTPSEILNIVFQINRAIQKDSPAGEEINPAEAEALGRAIWAALKD